MSTLDQPIYLVAALRTPIGRFGGGLSSLSAPDLGVASAKATIARSGIDPLVISANRIEGAGSRTDGRTAKRHGGYASAYL